MPVSLHVVKCSWVHYFVSLCIVHLPIIIIIIIIIIISEY